MFHLFIKRLCRLLRWWNVSKISPAAVIQPAVHGLNENWRGPKKESVFFFILVFSLQRHRRLRCRLPVFLFTLHARVPFTPRGQSAPARRCAGKGCSSGGGGGSTKRRHSAAVSHGEYKTWHTSAMCQKPAARLNRSSTPPPPLSLLREKEAKQSMHSWKTPPVKLETVLGGDQLNRLKSRKQQSTLFCRNGNFFIIAV